jgi:hypothetical protein
MSHHYPENIHIVPDYWTPEQAMAVFELLDLLRDLVCDRYGLHIQNCMQEQFQFDFDPGPPTDPPF